jgi:hypothetical protein
MKYKTLGMLKNAGMGKDVNDNMSGLMSTPYLLAQQRQRYLVTVNHEGRLVQDGFLLNTSGDPTGYNMFVMDGDGAIYSGSKAELNHHSAFLAGGPVASAGVWRVSYGMLKAVSDQSGHYRPPRDYAEQVLTELKRRGVNVHGVIKEWGGSKSKDLAKVAKAADVTFERMGATGVSSSRF